MSLLDASHEVLMTITFLDTLSRRCHLIFLDDISELKLNLPPLLMYLTEYLSPEF